MTILDLIDGPWATTESHLRLIDAIYTARISGQSFDRSEFEARTGKPMAGPVSGYEVQDNVAIIPIHGTIAQRMNLMTDVSGGTSSEMLVKDLKEATASNEIKGIILSMDSPGGAVAGTQKAAKAVEEARKVKPVYALTDGMMASAAYWIGSAAEKVYVGSEVDQLGSIGVIAKVRNTTKAQEMAGIKTQEIIAGKYKNAGSENADMTDEMLQVLQDQVDAIYRVFVGDVARYRGTGVKQVLSSMADGRVFVGDQAISAGLADGYSTVEQLIGSINRTRSQKSTRRVTMGALPSLPAYASR